MSPKTNLLVVSFLLLLIFCQKISFGQELPKDTSSPAFKLHKRGTTEIVLGTIGTVTGAAMMYFGFKDSKSPNGDFSSGIGSYTIGVFGACITACGVLAILKGRSNIRKSRMGLSLQPYKNAAGHRKTVASVRIVVPLK